MIHLYPQGGTPIDAAEIDDLIPSSISTQGELNAFEQANMVEAHKWLLNGRKRDIVTSRFLKDLHLKMFDQTWRWAGKYRQSEKTIGIPHANISRQLEVMCRDVRYWIQEKTFSADEIAVRFHHQLVLIHCFSNGNGRHARLAADCLIEELGNAKFTWGRGDLHQEGDRRKRYIECLKAADEHNVGPLLKFARCG